MARHSDCPTLEDMGRVLWGVHWREALAKALDVSPEEVMGWEADPACRPGDLQGAIENLGVVRLEEIGLLLVQMKELGLAAD